MSANGTRPLWGAFVVLFGVVVAAAFGPVEPVVWAFPAWAVVVLGGVIGAVAVGVVAVVGHGWPRGAGEPAPGARTGPGTGGEGEP
ncbi:MAG: hypothetical protein ABEH40_02910 [Haloferacaceae archaeon]